jgi:hypothetical protein
MKGSKRDKDSLEYHQTVSRKNTIAMNVPTK